MLATATDTQLEEIPNHDDFDSDKFLAEFREAAQSRGLEMPSARRDNIPIETDDWVREILQDGPQASDLLAEAKGEKPTASTVQSLIESVGGMEGLKLLSELINSDASAAANLQKLIPAEAQQEFAYEVIENNADTLLQDPEIQTRIAQAFGCENIEQINNALAFFDRYGEGLPQRDPVQVEIERGRSKDFEQNFFVNTEVLDVLRPFAESLDSAVIDDAGHAAQSRFLASNAEAFMRLQNRYARGEDTGFESIRLQNKFMATLIGCLNRAAGKTVRPATKPAKPVDPKPAATSDEIAQPGLDASPSEYSAYFAQEARKARA